MREEINERKRGQPAGGEHHANFGGAGVGKIGRPQNGGAKDMRNVLCHGCRLYGHYKADSPSEGSQQPDTRLCHNYHQSRHLSHNCTRPRDNGQ